MRVKKLKYDCLFAIMRAGNWVYCQQRAKRGGGLYGCLLTKYLKFYATVEFIYENNETAAGR